jgi:hypothetical protein
MSGRKHLCFFSMTCRHCQAFLGELSKTPYASEFELICVDPGKRPPSFTLPSWLKVVPTLVIKGESEPRTGPGPVTNWIFERRMADTAGESGIKTSTGGARTLEERNAPLAMPVYTADVPRLTISHVATSRSSAAIAATSSSATAVSEEGPTPYHINEMGANKLSDSYGFLADAFSIEKGTGTNRIVRNFAQLKDVVGTGAGAGAAKPTMTKKEEALVSAMEQYTKMRDSDIPGPIKRM